MWLSLIILVITAYLIHKILLSKTRKPGWWEKHGIPEVDATSGISALDILLGKKSISQQDDYVYEVMGSKKFCGVLESPEPVILLKDLDVIKKVFIKDFDHFADRRDFFPVADKTNILSKMLGLLKGDSWKNVRSSVSPTFTTGKIRRMMEHFNTVGQEWIDMFSSKAKASPSGSATIDAFSSINQYAIEVIATAVFGLKTGTIQDPNSIFAQKAARIANMDRLIDIIKFNLSPRYPKIFKMLGIEAVDMDAINFFANLMKQTLEARLRGETKRNDFVQLLIEARKGELKAVGSDDLDLFEKDALIKSSNVAEKNDKSKYLTDEIIIAQGAVFFFAGFTAVTNFVAFAAYALALHPEIQEKLREDVNKIVKEDGTLDYDDVGQLGYLEMVSCEVLRKFPGAMRLERTCVKDYHDPDSGLFVPKNSTVIIPVNAIHNDKKYYENPDAFDPEHFSPEKKGERSPYVYMPFGIGPRNCIGMRFAIIEGKSAIAKLVHNFLIEPTQKTPTTLQSRLIGAGAFLPADLELKLTPLKKV